MQQRRVKAAPREGRRTAQSHLHPRGIDGWSEAHHRGVCRIEPSARHIGNLFRGHRGNRTSIALSGVCAAHAGDVPGGVVRATVDCLLGEQEVGQDRVACPCDRGCGQASPTNLVQLLEQGLESVFGLAGVRQEPNAALTARGTEGQGGPDIEYQSCLLYTSDAADE